MMSSSRIQWRERINAALLHLLITLIVAGLVAAIVFFVWFPGAFADMMGGARLFLIVIGCDLVLGPLVSLIIFNKRKSRTELIADYTVVGFIQIVALLYGVSIVSSSRPVFVAFTKDRFEVVAALELADADLAAATDRRFRHCSWWGPRLVGVELPTDGQERTELLFSAIAGKDAQLMPKYYRSFSSMQEEVVRRSLPLSMLVEQNPDASDEIETAVRRLASAGHEEVRWLPVKHRFGFWTALIDDKTGKPLRYLPIDPY